MCQHLHPGGFLPADDCSYWTAFEWWHLRIQLPSVRSSMFLDGVYSKPLEAPFTMAGMPANRRRRHVGGCMGRVGAVSVGKVAWILT